MNTSVLSKRIAGESLRPKARTAGVLFLLSVGTALVGELLLHGSANIAAGLVAVVCYVGVTLLFYSIFKTVTRTLALLAVSFNLLGLVLEALRLEPGGFWGWPSSLPAWCGWRISPPRWPIASRTTSSSPESSGKDCCRFGSCSPA